MSDLIMDFFSLLTVIGCPYLAPPEGADIHVTEKEATISCTNSVQSWKLTCDGKKWIGDYSNCTNCKLINSPLE